MVAVALAALATWWFVLRADAPPPVALDDAIAAATSTTNGTDPTAGSEAVVIDGRWIVAAGGDSFAGYRVQEELARIGFTEAAGRTDRVEASLTIADGAVTAVDVTVDMRTLESDDARRDGALRSQALETDDFPTASFTLTAPIELPEAAAAGEPFSLTAVGDLTLHGVTRSLDLALDAQLVGDTIVVVGSAEILFADYDIDQPVSMALLSVDDHGLMEFQLLFGRP